MVTKTDCRLAVATPMALPFDRQLLVLSRASIYESYRRLQELVVKQPVTVAWVELAQHRVSEAFLDAAKCRQLRSKDLAR